MKDTDRKLLLKKSKPVIARIERLHPFKMLGYLLILSSLLALIFMIISFFQSIQFRIDQFTPYKLPRFYAVSTLILSLSMIFSVQILNLYQHDQVRRLRIALSMVLIMGLVFIITQSLAWLELLHYPSEPQAQILLSYLFIFSGSHMVLMVGALVLVAVLFYKISSIEDDPVKSLILLTNPYEKVKLEIFTTAWHYLVATWLFLFLLFLFIV